MAHTSSIKARPMNGKELVQTFLKSIVPLEGRKRLSIWVDRQSWVPARHRWSAALVRDVAQSNPEAFHRFVWTNHIGPAKQYEKTNPFDTSRLLATHRMIFDDVIQQLKIRNLDPQKDIKSVCDVGCATGHLLRYMETQLFPSAERLVGFDIDAHAITKGSSVLRDAGSKVNLICADIANLERYLADQQFDIIFSMGVLVCVSEELARKLVDVMLKHARVMVAFSGPANPAVHNAQMPQSLLRQDGAGLVHNFDAMVKLAKGKVLFQRWEGARMVDGYSFYYVVASPDPLQKKNHGPHKGITI